MPLQHGLCLFGAAGCSLRCAGDCGRCGAAAVALGRLALELADRAYLIETGRIVIGGAAETLRGDESVRRAYLGDDGMVA